MLMSIKLLKVRGLLNFRGLGLQPLLPVAPAEQAKAAEDDQLVAIWLHGRSEHTVRAYQADLEGFRVRAGKPE